MSNIKEKLMAFLLATTQDEELIVAGRIPELFQQNRDAAVRLLAMCGSFFCLVFLWLRVPADSAVRRVRHSGGRRL